MAKIAQNRQIALCSLWSFNQSEAGKKKQKKIVFMRPKNIVKSTNVSQSWIREIIQIVFFHLMFESVQIFGFPQIFWNSVPKSRSNIKQTVLSGTVFRKGWLNLTYSYILSRSENFILIGSAFVLNKFEYCRGDTLFEPVIYR